MGTVFPGRLRLDSAGTERWHLVVKTRLYEARSEKARQVRLDMVRHGTARCGRRMKRLNGFSRRK